MELTEFKAELVAIGLTVVSAFGWVIRMIVKDRVKVEQRIDHLEQENVLTKSDLHKLQEELHMTRQEFAEFAKEVHAHNGKLRDVLDSRLSAMNDHLIALLKKS